MKLANIWENLALEKGGNIVYLILDGLGGIQNSKSHKTELEEAKKPNLDALAKCSSCGLLEIVGAGITPGSGPGHLALFGYNPLEYNIGRGVFSALGINFDLQEGDLPCRFNFCSVDEKGRVTDRRAGRIKTELNKKLCEKLRQNIRLADFEYFIETESEHRGLLVLRGSGLYSAINDTDPGREGLAPLEPKALDERSQKAAQAIQKIVTSAKEILKDEHPANSILLRGFERYKPIAGLYERFKLKGLCIAEYPMYKGVSRFLKMDVIDAKDKLPGLVKSFQESYGKDYNFYFIHVKYADKAGEDHDFDRKVKVIEEVDQIIPKILSLNPDVFVVTGDHSTPSAMGLHSWHTVPVLISAANVRQDRVESFDEISCIQGGLGIRPAVELMGLSLAHAGRLKKFGA